MGERVFLSKHEAMSTIGLCDAANIKRHGHVGVRCAIKAGETVFEALPRERLHAQMWCRLAGDKTLPPDAVAAFEADEYIDGFTVELSS